VGKESQFSRAAPVAHHLLLSPYLLLERTMITKLTHMCIYVLDQDSAYDFYVNKLGFTVRVDAPMNQDSRWLTVCPPEQPGLEISLFLVVEGEIFTPETVVAMTTLIRKGTTTC
jgi:hypothetical protein